MKQEQRYKITSTSALLMHNGQLNNPLNAYSKLMKKISGKRNKTEADYEEMGRIEWHGSLYLHEGKPCIPGEILQATLTNGAKKIKKGQQAKAGLLCLENAPIQYKGPQEIAQLWAEETFRHVARVLVNRQGVMRTRPLFAQWQAEITITFNDEMLNPSDITDIVTIAGDQVGLMDWRPRYGRFRLL